MLVVNSSDIADSVVLHLTHSTLHHFPPFSRSLHALSTDRVALLLVFSHAH